MLEEGYPLFNWIGIFLVCTGMIGFLVGLYKVPSADDTKGQMQKHLLRWECPAIMLVGISSFFASIDALLFYWLGVLFSSSALGIFFALKEQRNAKK